MIERTGGPSGVARQRWRVVFARGHAAGQFAHAEALKRWESALLAAGIPLAFSLGQPPRARLVFAAPLPAGMLAAGELADLVLAERLTMPELRARLNACLPAGYCLVDLFDVWLGEPTAAATLVAADYRVVLRAASNAELAEACAALLGAAQIPRARTKGSGGASVPFDLRPQLLGLEVAADMPVDPCPAAVSAAAALAVSPAPVLSVATDPGATPATMPPVTVRMRLQLARDAAAARPEEVVHALAQALGRPLDTVLTTRERLWTVSDLDDRARASGR